MNSYINFKLNASPMLKKSLFFLVLSLLSYKYMNAQEKDKKEKKISFKDSLDGAFDVSEFIIDPKGFMLVPIVITEPAIGYGGGLAVLYFQPQKKKYDSKVPPNISGLIGLGTSNKTWMGALFHFHVWGPDKIRYVGLVARPSVNIKYYGNNNRLLNENPVEFNLNSWFILQRVNVRIKNSNLFLGGTYSFAQSDVLFDPVPDRPLIDNILSRLNGKTIISSIQPLAKWDSRDNIFTPKIGLNTGLEFSYSATWLGADEEYFSFNPFLLAYKPLSNKLFSAWRFDAEMMAGDAPFYAKPFVQMRGVPAMKFQSNNTMVVETEWKYNVYKRWSLNTFLGAGKAFRAFEEFGKATLVHSYGVGFRYKISRLFGIDAGVDFAWSNKDDFAFTIVFGSAWNR